MTIKSNCKQTATLSFTFRVIILILAITILNIDSSQETAAINKQKMK